MKTVKKHFPNIILFLCAYLVIYGSYLLTSEGLGENTVYLQSRRYVPCALAVVIAVSFWQRFKLPLYKLYPHGIVSLFWILTYPVCYWLTFHLNTNYIDNHFDQAFGAYIFSVTVYLRLLLYYFSAKRCLNDYGNRIIGVLHFLLMLVPLTEIVYFRTYNRPVSEAACIALLQTNPSEAREFILQAFGYSGIAGAVLFLLFLLYFFIKSNRLPQPEFQSDSLPGPLKEPRNTYAVGKKTLAVMLVLVIATGYYCVHIFHWTGVLERLVFAQEYYRESEKFTAFHKENFSRLQVTPPVKTFAKPSTILMVIGESASRSFLSAYGYSKYDTTPWLKSCLSHPDFIIYRHAYTSAQQTVASLERALTEKNQYNDKEFNQSYTILDLAKKAGYTTYWFSNQGTISNADTPITLVARTADHYAWIEDSLANTGAKKYDMDLLHYLKQVDTRQNNFIVLHIMGSHDNFYNRYPREFTRWGNPDEYIPEIGYANSLAYTDNFLKELFAYGIKNLNLQAMLYFSDHGTIPGRLRNADITSFTALQIPMFLYLSQEYRALYPETVSALQNHADAYFTNDLMYETVAGLLNIRSDHYNPENSLASPLYKWNRNTLKTNLGKMKLSSDVTKKRK